MTISPPIAETDAPVQGLSPTDSELFDEAEIGRLANALFRTLPGLDGLGRGAAPQDAGLQGADRAPDVLGEAPDLGPLTPAQPSVGGLGLSPGGFIPRSPDSALAPSAGYSTVETPGAGLPPIGVSGIGPLPSASPQAVGGLGFSPGGLQPPSTPPGAAYDGYPSTGEAPAATDVSALYIVSEARPSSPTDFEGAPGADDRVTPRADLLPGAEALAILLGTGPAAADAPLAPSPTSGDASQFEQPPARAVSGYPAFDVQAVRGDFPILSEKVHGRPLIWLDNGATTQKPQAVIDRIAYFYAHENSNVHRAAHTMAARATDAYENARKTTARFLGAASTDEIVFVRGATEAINLVAQAWGRQNVGAGDEIILSHLEHHANIVPWQLLAAEKGAKIRVIPVDDSGQILLSEYERLLSDKTKIVAVTHVSNALGTVVPIKAIVDRAHAAGARVLIDGAQSVAHARVNVQALDADFYVFSGHKIFAPTGIGVLYGKRDVLNAMPPWQGGGNMIADVTFEKTEYQAAPSRFEAGTGNLADAVGLGAALEYLERIGLENIARHEHDLLEYATPALLSVPGLTIIGTAAEKVSVLSFLLDGFAPEEVGSALDQYGIAVRSGHHCAQPILRRYGLEGTVRASLALYNTYEDIDCLVSALRQIAATRGKARV